jgi:hypothetical protein
VGSSASVPPEPPQPVLLSRLLPLHFSPLQELRLRPQGNSRHGVSTRDGVAFRRNPHHGARIVDAGRVGNLSARCGLVSRASRRRHLDGALLSAMVRRDWRCARELHSIIRTLIGRRYEREILSCCSCPIGDERFNQSQSCALRRVMRFPELGCAGEKV